MVIEGAKDCSYAVLDEHCEQTGININSMIMFCLILLEQFPEERLRDNFHSNFKIVSVFSHLILFFYLYNWNNKRLE